METQAVGCIFSRIALERSRHFIQLKENDGKAIKDEKRAISNFRCLNGIRAVIGSAQEITCTMRLLSNRK